MALKDECAQQVQLEHVTKKSESGLVFYRKCIVDSQSFCVGNNVLLRSDGRYKLGYLLKIYCRTKGNERALVRWFYTNSDMKEEEQHADHEIFATSYTGKVAVSTIRKLIHVIFTTHQDGIPSTVPKDVYYVYRYFDHDKQALVPLHTQLSDVRYMPKPVPDSIGSSLSVNKAAAAPTPAKSDIKLSVPFTEDGNTFYKLCSVGRDRYKIGDCVKLVERDGSSIRRIISFSYNMDQTPIALGQFVYYQNEVTLSVEQRSSLNYQEVLVSNWKRELLISNIKRKLTVVHQNIFQPVPPDAIKTALFMKRYYDPFKKKIYPLAEPLTRSDFSITPAPLEECKFTPYLSEPKPGKEKNKKPLYRTCTLGEDSFSVGDFVTLQSGSVCARILRMYHGPGEVPVMDINKLFTLRNVPSSLRKQLTTSLLFSAECYYAVSCDLFFERIDVVFDHEDITNDSTFVAGDFFCPDSKKLFHMATPPSILGHEEVPERGRVKTASSEEEEEEDKEQAHDSYESEKEEKLVRKGSKAEKTSASAKRSTPKVKKKKLEQPRSQQQHEVDKNAKVQERKEKEKVMMDLLQQKEVCLGEKMDENQYKSLQVGLVKASVGDCVFVELVEGIQIGRIISIYQDEDEVIRLKMHRFYLEEEMFVSKRESSSIHINEVFASDFIINALGCQLNERVDCVFLKKKEKIPPQDLIPKGRLFVRRYYHPKRRLLRSLLEPLNATDVSIIPQPHPPISGIDTEDKTLNKAPDLSHAVAPRNTKKTEKADTATNSNASTEKRAMCSEALPSTDFPKISIVTGTSDEQMTVLPESMISFSHTDNTPSADINQGAESTPKTIEIHQGAEATPQTIEIHQGAEVTPQTIEIHQGAEAIPQTIEIRQGAEVTPQTIEIHQGAEVAPQTIEIRQGAEATPQTIEIHQGAEVTPQTIEIHQGAEATPQTIEIHPQQVSAQSTSSGLTTIEIVPSDSTKPSAPQIALPSASESSAQNTIPQSIEIISHANADASSKQIQISISNDSSESQIVTADASAIQVVHSTEHEGGSSFLPTIISSEQDMHSPMDVDISHADDGSITIAPVLNKAANVARFEDSYTRDGKVYFRLCHFKQETIKEGDAVYVRCNDQNLANEEESWKLGRAMAFYHSSYPVVRLLWFYVVEEMVTSKTERASIHMQEVFASQCFDEIEISSIESKANIVYMQLKDKIPRIPDPSALYCRRFYDPYKHMIRPLKTRLSADDISILPEPQVRGSSMPGSKRARSAQNTPEVKRPKLMTPPTSSKRPIKTSPRKTLEVNRELLVSPKKTPIVEIEPIKLVPPTNNSLLDSTVKKSESVDDKLTDNEASMLFDNSSEAAPNIIPLTPSAPQITVPPDAPSETELGSTEEVSNLTLPESVEGKIQKQVEPSTIDTPVKIDTSIPVKMDTLIPTEKKTIQENENVENAGTLNAQNEPHADLPHQPHVDSPQEPHVDSPQEPHFDLPQEPHVDLPHEPDVDLPQEPHTDLPHEPQVDSPQEPCVDSPHEPQVDPPQEPHVDSPNEPHVDLPHVSPHIVVQDELPEVFYEESVDVPSQNIAETSALEEKDPPHSAIMPSAPHDDTSSVTDVTLQTVSQKEPESWR